MEKVISGEELALLEKLSSFADTLHFAASVNERPWVKPGTHEEELRKLILDEK